MLIEVLKAPNLSDAQQLNLLRYWYTQPDFSALCRRLRIDFATEDSFDQGKCWAILNDAELGPKPKKAAILNIAHLRNGFAYVACLSQLFPNPACVKTWDLIDEFVPDFDDIFLSEVKKFLSGNRELDRDGVITMFAILLGRSKKIESGTVITTVSSPSPSSSSSSSSSSASTLLSQFWFCDYCMEIHPLSLSRCRRVHRLELPDVLKQYATYYNRFPSAKPPASHGKSALIHFLSNDEKQFLLSSGIVNLCPDGIGRALEILYRSNYFGTDLPARLYDALYPVRFNEEQPFVVSRQDADIVIRFKFQECGQTDEAQFMSGCGSIAALLKQSAALRDYYSSNPPSSVKFRFYFDGLPAHAYGYYSMVLQQLMSIADEYPHALFRVFLPASDLDPRSISLESPPQYVFAWSYIVNLGMCFNDMMEERYKKRFPQSAAESSSYDSTASQQQETSNPDICSDLYTNPANKRQRCG